MRVGVTRAVTRFGPTVGAQLREPVALRVLSEVLVSGGGRSSEQLCCQPGLPSQRCLARVGGEQFIRAFDKSNGNVEDIE